MYLEAKSINFDFYPHQSGYLAFIHKLHIFEKSTFGQFSCDVRDIQIDIFEGKPPKNLNFK